MNTKDTDSGAYVLLLQLKDKRTLIIGALGEYQFQRGFYAYIGSALGPGGFKRILRHIRVSKGVNKVRKWHIDYLSSVSTIIEAHKVFTKERLECAIATMMLNDLGTSSMLGFGSSDCKCRSHLFYSEKLAEIKNAVVRSTCQL
jgi:Uri superfamily endonuclease